MRYTKYVGEMYAGNLSPNKYTGRNARGYLDNSKSGFDCAHRTGHKYDFYKKIEL